MLVDWIFLVDINLEELIVSIALKVLITRFHLSGSELRVALDILTC